MGLTFLLQEKNEQWSALPVQILKPQMLGSQSMAVHYGKIQRDAIKIACMQHISHSLRGPSGKTMRCIFRCFPLLLSPLFSPQMYFYAAYVFQEAGIPQDKIPYVVIGTGSCELITSVTCVRLLMHCADMQTLLTVRRLLITNFGFTLLFMPRKPFMHSRQPVSQHSCPDRLMQKYFVRHCIVITV